MQFVKVGELVINLANVLFVERGTFDNRACVKVWFNGLDEPLRIYSKSAGYAELVAWLEEQATLLGDD